MIHGTLGLVIALTAVVGFFSIKALRVLKGDPVRGKGQSQDDEARLIQEIHHGLSEMERRIEALETILLDRERRGQDK